MANAIFRTPAFFVPLSDLSTTSLETPRFLRFSSKQRSRRLVQPNISRFSNKLSLHFPKLLPFAASGEATETDQFEEIETEENFDDEVLVENGASDGGITAEEKPTSAILPLLETYKEALVGNDEPKVAEIEALLQSIEDEKISLANKVATLSEEMSMEKDRILRISADFDNFRKRTERERLSLVTNAQGEVVESLLPVLDNFERAKSQIKVETEGEEKINNSYQSICKQFIEILGSLGVVPVETVGNNFDPLLHEAIMREDSTEFEEGIIIQEFRKGFKLGDRLLRPSMVKVSAGPGPAKPQEGPLEDDDGSSERTEEGRMQGESDQ
ncbi:PREDICTED: uncharacterized protein LOC104589240 isoform X2 [Nelumbo nucifera]|uniref:GrpE protein homolog n=2 Tax=Nelumbo nucifera TaxID=4432 RepID=A0A1U7ZEC3_NELNU|nr:PREDICTED: uncharacterized protein LOC104589240 isoform X2 [Nelumbo nucifera]DAD29275.1 TPA_asm: hypothetical protein HUJ06_030743 [Nelumbo nucifera]